MENEYELSLQNSHPKAQKLLIEDFYWSPIEESAPFGNDDGSDAFYSFRQWRVTNKNESPVKYLEQLIDSWGYPKFDLNEMDSSKINEYISAKGQVDTSSVEDFMPELLKQAKKMAKDAGKEFDEKQFRQILEASSSSMGDRYLLGQDNAVIAIGFGQFVLEGRIDEDIKILTQTAIKRELLPVLIDKWDEAYKKTRVEQLTKMLNAVDKMNN